MHKPPDTEYFSFKLKYKQSEYNSEHYGGYFPTLKKAEEAATHIMDFHKTKIERDVGDIYEKPIVYISRVSKILTPEEVRGFDPDL